MKFLALCFAAALLAGPLHASPNQPSNGFTIEPITLELSDLARSAENDKIALPPPTMPPLKERLLEDNPERREDSFGNSRVELAPKAWPYPMVVSPGRPVLPGSAW